MDAKAFSEESWVMQFLTRNLGVEHGCKKEYVEILCSRSVFKDYHSKPILQQRK